MADQNQGQNQGGGQGGKGPQIPKIKCPNTNCGADNFASNDNCATCATALRVACKQCGAIMVASRKKCAKCGVDLPVPIPPANQPAGAATTAQPTKTGGDLWAVRILAPMQRCRDCTLGFQITNKGTGTAGQVRVTIDGHTLILDTNDKGLAELPIVVDRQEIRVIANVVGYNNPEAEDSATLLGKPPKVRGSFWDKFNARRGFYKPQQ